jgi:hypothetical protein
MSNNKNNNKNNSNELSFDIRENLYEKTIKLKFPNGVKEIIVVITDEDYFTLKQLDPKNLEKLSEKEGEELNDKVLDIIWGSSKDKFKDDLGDFQFDTITIGIISDVMGFLANHKVKTGTKRVKKYKELNEMNKKQNQR